MTNEKDKFTREEALEEVSKITKGLADKERKTRAIDFLSILVALLVSILSCEY